jgi:nucleotide-binding universal stress UspA family protein
MFKFRKILVPTDFSEQFIITLNYAKELIKSGEDTELHIIHVIEHSVYPADLGITQASFIDLEKEMNKKSVEQLEYIKHDLEREEINPHIHINTGRASDRIMEYANLHKIDLICIATHGRSGLEHFLFGSTAEKVLRKAPCPVLAVRMPTNK